MVSVVKYADILWSDRSLHAGYNAAASLGKYGKHRLGLRWIFVRTLSELEVLLGQYTTFLEYLADREKTYLIPSAEIDLIWHTHQLSPFRYRWDHLFVCQFQLVNIIWQRDDTLALLGVFVDHLCHEEDLASYCTSAFQIKSKKNPLTQYQIGEMMHVLMCGTYVFVALWPMTKKNQSSFLRMSLGLMGTELFYVSLSVAHLWHVTSSSSELNHLVILSDWHV